MLTRRLRADAPCGRRSLHAPKWIVRRTDSIGYSFFLAMSNVCTALPIEMADRPWFGGVSHNLLRKVSRERYHQ